MRMKNLFLVIVLFSLTLTYTTALSAPGKGGATQFDVGVSVLNWQKWIPNDEIMIVSGKVKNYGVQPISSFQINYQIDGGEVFTYDATGFLLNFNEELPFNHPDLVEPFLGNHTIKIWTSLPNGEEDEDNKNDTLTFSYTIYKALTGRPRTILLEGFSASTCGPCVSGNINLKKVLAENNGRYAVVKYQMDFPGSGDPYYTAECGTRGSFYYVSSVPTIQVDGSAYKNSTHQLKNYSLEELQNVPALMEVDVDYYVEGKTVYAKAKVTPAEDISDANLKLFMAIIEKNTYNNVGSNGETEFDHILKKFMPHVNGIELGALSANTSYVALQNWEFKGNYRLPANANSPINHNIEHSVEDFNNLKVVAWVQNTQNRVMYQAANGIGTSGPTAVFGTVPAIAGTVTATLNGAPIISGKPVGSEETLIFTAEVNEGFEFKEWRYNGTVVGSENTPITITTNGNYVDVSAIFLKADPKVTYSVVNNFGTITAVVDGTGIVSGGLAKAGAEITFAAQPEEGWEVKEWKWNQKVISVANSFKKVIDEEDIYVTVEFIQKLGCKENTRSHILLYPNPFTNSFTIANAENIRKVTIINIFGQIVHEKTFAQSSAITVNANELVRGIYLVALWSVDGERLVYKMIKQE